MQPFLTANPKTSCPHVGTHTEFRLSELKKAKEVAKCSKCQSKGPNLWLCVFQNCYTVGCGEEESDHSTTHSRAYPDHCIHINLTTKRVWCFICEYEVSLESLTHAHNYFLLNSRRASAATKPTSSDYMAEDGGKFRGLTGLQNMGNTCYMNSALQALSNTVPLTLYFINGDTFTFKEDPSKFSLAQSYTQLMRDMWLNHRIGVVVPSSILFAIRNVYPMYRGFHQHDAQEFLRCFMDLLHDELKEPVNDISIELSSEDSNSNFFAQMEDLSDEEETSSQSEGEYETCDSGVSERSSLSDDCERGKDNNSRRKLLSSSSSSVDKGKSRTSLNSSSGHGSSSSKLGQTSTRRSSSLSPKSGSIFTKSSTSPRSGSSSSSSPARTRKKMSIKFRSIISSIFDGKILSSVQCLTCDRVSNRIETFQDISLPIPTRDHIHMIHRGSFTPQKLGIATCSDVYASDQGWLVWLFEWFRSWFWGPTISLHDCLAAFFSADELKGDNMYSCERCKLLRNGMKFSKVLELPEVLTIHLKRFRHDIMFSTKLGNGISFPLVGLDMRPYLHKDCTSQVSNYDLYAVICHMGTAGGGHYLCYCLNFLNNEWFEFDDNCVTKVPPETVQNCEAYVLFYRKSNESMIDLRHRAQDLCKLSKREPSLLNFYISKQWLHRFNTFAEPGPINNRDFLCVHGCVNPEVEDRVQDLSMVISQSVWEYLYEHFGGGPPCNRLYSCVECQMELDAIYMRKQKELQSFVELSDELQMEENPSILYALSMDWFRQWQNFVRGKDTESPGPIDNTPIITVINGQQTLLAGSDYAQLSPNLWRFFHTLYKGGPEVILVCSQSAYESESEEYTYPFLPQKAHSTEDIHQHMTSLPNRTQSYDNFMQKRNAQCTSSKIEHTDSQYSGTLDDLFPESESDFRSQSPIFPHDSNVNLLDSCDELSSEYLLLADEIQKPDGG